MMDRAGKLKTNLSGEAAYKSFTPAPLPPNPPIELDSEAVKLLVKANKQLALLEGIATRIPNVNLFVSITESIEGMGRAAKTALRLFAYLEENPIIEIQKTADALGTTFKTISASVRRLCEMRILAQNSGDQRNRTFSYAAYLDILREGT
ncbi:MAG: hypothetical protein FWF88_02220 [Peptococcaceae bacterium]|nr:hypothetical protein [Peptococcaceae bacterium]